MAEDEIMIEDDAIALEDVDDTSVTDVDVTNIIPFIMERYKRSEDYRYQDEERWLKAYRNYRGLYGPDVQFTETEKSRVFIKVTKTKNWQHTGKLLMFYLLTSVFLYLLNQQSYQKVLSQMYTLTLKNQNNCVVKLPFQVPMVLQEMVKIFLQVLQKSLFKKSLGS